MTSEILQRHPEFSKVITYTTRPPREREIPGVHYHFVTRGEFLQMREVGEFIETDESYPLTFTERQKAALRGYLQAKIYS